MLEITRRDMKRNVWVRSETKVQDIIETVMKMKFKWAGHSVRRTDERWTAGILSWIPQGGRRLKERPLG